MKPVMYVHVGTPKTGTTSLQAQLAAHRASLRDQGYVYPDSRPFFAGIRTAHHGIADSLVVDPPINSSVELFLAHARATAVDGATVLVSSENLYYRTSGALPYAPDLWAASGKAGREVYLRRLADQLKGFDVRVIVFLRSPDAFAEAMYKEVLKYRRPNQQGSQRQYRGTFREFLTQSALLWDYDYQVRLLEELVGPTTVLRYEDGNVIDRYAAHVGISLLTPPESARENVSAGPLVSLCLRHCNVGSTQERNDFGQSELARGLFPAGERVSLWDSDDHRREFLASLPNERYGSEYFPEPRTGLAAAHVTASDVERFHLTFAQWLRERTPLGEMTLAVPGN